MSNEYDSLIAGGGYDQELRLQDERQRLRQSMYGATQVNPDQYGQAKQLERKTGVPAPVGVRNLPEVKLKADLNEFDQLLQSSPVLARQLQRADFASMSHDDVQNLAQAEALLRPPVKPWLTSDEFSTLVRETKAKNPSFDWDTARKAALAQIAGVNNQRQDVGIHGPANTLRSKIESVIASIPIGLNRMAQGVRGAYGDLVGDYDAVYKSQERTRQLDVDEALMRPRGMSPTEEGVVSGLSSLVQQAPGIAASILTANPLPALAYIGTTTTTQAYGKYRERGGTPGEAALGSLGEGVTEVATEAMPMSFLVRSFGKVGAGQFLAGLLGREVPGEQVATFVQDAIDTAVANPDKTWGEFLAERPNAAYVTFVATLTQTGVMGAVHKAAQIVSGGEQRAQQAEEHAKALQQLATLSVASRLRERDPQSFEQFVNAAAEDGPVQEVFIDARVFAQAVGDRLPEVLQASPAAAAQFEEAARVGGDIVIPLGEYAANIAASDLNNTLMPHLRTSADAMSMEDAKTFMQSEVEKFKAEAEKILEKKGFDTAFQESATAVEKELLAQFKAANRFTDDVNQAKATYAALVYKQIAARLGITPEQAYVKFALNIGAESVAQQNVMDQGVRDEPQLRRGAEYEGRLWGGAYDNGRFESRILGKDAPMRAAIVSARENYNTLRAAFGLPAVVDWSKRPEQTLEKLLRERLTAAKQGDVANAKDSGYNADSLAQGEQDGSGSDLDFTGAGSQSQELHATVGGGRAREGWADATRIRGKSGPLAVSRGQQRALTAADFDVEALGHNTEHPTSGFGVFFTTSVEVAAKHGDVATFFLDIRKPKVIKADEMRPFDSVQEAHTFREKLRAEGFDGIIVSARHLDPNGRVDIAVFDANQVIYPQAKVLAQGPKLGGTKVVDKHGAPLLVHHGTNAEFAKLEAARATANHPAVGGPQQTRRAGIFFSDSKKVAEEFAKARGGERVVSAYLSIKNPLDMREAPPKSLLLKLDTAGFGYWENLEERWGGWDLFDFDDGAKGGDQFVEFLREQGYDGAIFEEDGANTYVAFDANQVIYPQAKVLAQAPKDALIVQHNVTAENLLHALRMGGIPVPSLAISKANDALINFGEITLIGPREMADPRGVSRPRVFAADIYSPRYPDTTHRLDKPELKKLNAILAPYRQGDEREVYGGEVTHLRDLEGIKAFRRYEEDKLGKDATYSERRAFAENILREIGAQERIFLGFTYSGNRRYKPHTLENVVKILKKELRGGESSGNLYGMGQLRAKFAPQFKSITGIQNARGRIVTNEQFAEVKKEVEAEFWKIVEAVTPYYKFKPEAFRFADTVIALIEDSARIGLNAAAKEYSFNELPDEVRQQVFEFVTRLRNMPTEYFEAKILRGVGIHEFTAAVVPEGTKQEVLDALKRAGVDVATYKKGDEKDRKRAVADTAAGYGENVLFQEQAEPAPTFYSALERQLAAAKMNTAPAQAWKDYLKSLVSKGQVKRDEIEWSGIEEWLGMQEGKVAREDVLDFLKDNGVRVTERVLGGAATFEASFGEWQDDIPGKSYFEEIARDLYLDDIKQDIAARDDIPVEEVDEKEAMGAAIQRAEHSFYDDPDRQQFREIEVEANGKTYRFIDTQRFGERDLFVFAPANQGNELDAIGGVSIELPRTRHGPDDAQIEHAIRSWLGKQLGIDFDEEGAPFADYTLPGGENYSVMLLTLPDAPPVNYVVEQEADGTWVAVDTTRNNTNVLRATNREAAEREAAQIMPGRMGKPAAFRSSHFDEPNILAHVRFKDRTDADGKKVLFIEEFQSDWAQKGKKEGFFDKARLDKLDAKLKNEGQLSPEEAAEYNRLTDQESMPRTHGGVPTAPFVTKTESWVALAMKRMIRYAAENGYDRIAWTTGEQQADRYSLRKSVRSIGWEPSAKGLDADPVPGGTRIQVSLRDGRGNIVVIVDKGGVVQQANQQRDNLVGKKLEDVIGKAAAEKILASPEGSLEGEGLAIGGEGMLAFYDRIVPNVANDVLKKLGGGRVGAISVGLHDKGSKRYDAKSQQPGFEITPALKEKAMAGQPLFQSNRGQIAFADDITSRPSTLTLLKNADLSTFFHEMGHFYLEVISHIAAQPDAPAEIRADMQIALNWFKPGMTLEQWRGMTLAEKRQYHEQWARGNEAYLFEGRAPSVELKPLFARFTAWMLHVYRYILGKERSSEAFQRGLAKAAGAEVRLLTDEVRGVLDRMLASREQILEAEAIRGYEMLFKSAEDAGMTPEEWKAYHNLSLDATQSAVDQLQTRSLRDMQWLTNARNKTLKRLQRAAEQKRKAVEAEVTTEVRGDPVYAAQRWLKTGEMTTPEGEEIKAEKGFRLNTEALAEMYPATMNARPDLTNLRGMTSPEGLHPDMVAEMFGFTSGDHLVRAILEAQPESAVIEGMTDQRMLERYGDLSSPEAIERAANEAIHNDARARFVATELRMLAKATGQRAVMTKAAKDFATTIVARKKVRDIKPAQYEAAEARAARAAEKALLAKNMPEAAVEKRNQLVNHYATRAAYDALDYVERNVRYLKRVGESETIDTEYREQIQALLERFDLRRVTAKDAARRRSLTQWIAAEREKGNEPVIDGEIENEANRKPHQDMTLEEFRGLVDAVKNIEHLGRLKHKLLTAQDEREFNARVAEAAASIEENAKRKVPAKLERNSWTDRMKDGATSFFVMHRKFAAMIREMDGWKDGGVLWELFSRPMNRAAAREAVLREQATTRLAEMFKSMTDWKKKTYIPAINNSLSREGRIMVALNAGNEGNLQRMMDGDHWSPAQVRAIIDTLEKHEMDFVQAVWDFVGEYRQEIGEQQRRLTGVDPEWVEATPVSTRHGTYRGGYIPVKYDSTRSTRSLSDEAAAGIMDLWRAARGSAKTRDSFTKARADKVVNRPLRKDFGVITQHVAEVTHRLAWQEFLVDAQRLLRAGPLDSAIREHYGHHVIEEMRNTIEDVAAGDLPAQNTMESIANHLRTGTSIAMMGWRLTTAMIQFTGFTQSAVRIGPKWIARGLAEFVGDAARMENTARRVSEKSDFMRLRGKTLQREVNEILNLVENRNSAIKASYFWMIQKMQMAVDIPTWLGQYHKAIESGANEDTAVAQADQAVKDSQGGGQIMDLAAVQRGSPYLKLFTNFYSYFNVTFNLSREVVGRTDWKNPLSVAKAAADLALLYTVPALAGSLMYAALEGEDDWDDLVRNIIADQVSFLLGTMVGLREIGGVARAAMGLPGEYRGPAGVRFFAEVYNLAKQTGQGEVDEAALKAASNTAGILFHLPAGQVNATLDGIHAIATGETEWPGALAVGHRDR